MQILFEGAGMNNLPTGSLTSLGTFAFLQKVDFNDICFVLFMNLHQRKTKGIADSTEQYFTSEKRPEVYLSDVIVREIILIDCPSYIDCILLLAKYVLSRYMSRLSR